MKKLFKSLFLVGMVSFAGAAAANAASGSWTNQSNEPLIYQTNFWEGPTTVAALSGTPASGVITNVSLWWGYNASTYGADPSYALEAEITAGGKMGYINANNKVGTSDLNDPYWAGKPANSTFAFRVHAYSSVTKAFVSALGPSRQFQVSVNYTY